LGGLIVSSLAAPEIASICRLYTVPIPGGEAFMGTDEPVFPGDGEGPFRQSKVAPFSITPTTITNLQFGEFVYETGYKTEAERFGSSFVFRDAVENTQIIETYVKNVPWWCKIDGADWLDPKGSNTPIENFESLPVVHVSWNDAAAYAMWAGGRLPTELEWEHAARGGLGDARYPWGDQEPTADDRKCHIGQIKAPHLKAQEIGPVRADSYQENGYGLYSMVGNVWEWTSDTAPSPTTETQGLTPRKILKGGSYMCHPDTCFRYRIAARISNTLDTTTGHTGFRVVF
tara:strand:+ start:104 stop:964 length:861 start_codon:yes stop_codon:yes gene_type:complete